MSNIQLFLESYEHVCLFFCLDFTFFSENLKKKLEGRTKKFFSRFLATGKSLTRCPFAVSRIEIRGKV